MDEACSALEIECKRVCNDLEFVSHRLESEFRSRSDLPDVVSLIRRIHALESNLIETKRKSEELLSRRRSVANRATSLLLNNHSQIAQLIDDTECQNVSEGEDRRNTSVSDDSTLNSSTDKRSSESSRVLCEESQESKQDLLSVMSQCMFVDRSIITKFDNNNNNSNNVTDQNNNPSKLKEILSTNNTLNSTVEMKKTKTEKVEPLISDTNIFEISSEQFESIPTSTRGRCRLQDVQQVLTRLQTYYTTHINSYSSKKLTLASFGSMVPLSTADLTLSGLKVAGKTGDCVVGTLRSLGVIKLSKTGKQGILFKRCYGAKNA